MNKTSFKKLVKAIAKLSAVNRLTGIWDNRRYQECKKEFKKTNAKYIYISEKLSRKNVELRSKYRKVIDKELKNLLK